MHNRSIWTGMMATVVGLSLACGGEVSSANDPVLSEPAVIDTRLMTALEAVVSNCDINLSACSVTCSGEEKKAIVARYDSYNATDSKADAIDTLAVALANPDPKLQTAVTSILRSAFRSYSDVESVPPAAAMRLIEAWAPLPKCQANEAAESVVHAAMLSKHPAVAERMYRAIDEAAEHSTKAKATEHLLVYGRSRAFDKVKELGKDPSEEVVTGALDAWRALKRPTLVEKAVMCPWNDGFLQDARSDVFRSAGNGAAHCGGIWIDKLLDEGERRLAKDHTFERPHNYVFKELCYQYSGEVPEHRKAQCERNFAYLLTVVEDVEVPPEGRAKALYAIYYQRRDAKTKALAKSYLTHEEPKIAKEAQEIFDKLQDK